MGGMPRFTKAIQPDVDWVLGEGQVFLEIHLALGASRADLSHQCIYIAGNSKALEGSTLCFE